MHLVQFNLVSCEIDVGTREMDCIAQRIKLYQIQMNRLSFFDNHRCCCFRFHFDVADLKLTFDFSLLLKVV